MHGFNNIQFIGLLLLLAFALVLAFSYSIVKLMKK